ncbi:hypothetical protein C1H46_021746 [Malus baccata]|uniref:Uncharacterized protein n=1 Tax=Malus baccata TaxID=106549 RepID=A0A540M1K6_MALBA|nr:hypothetical protein C1H46_021746 [Malus baccata]
MYTKNRWPIRETGSRSRTSTTQVLDPLSYQVEEWQEIGEKFLEMVWGQTHANYGNEVANGIYASMVQKKDEYFATLSQQHPDVSMDELTPDPDVSLQVLMDRFGRRKGMAICNLGAGQVWEVDSCSSSSSTTMTETDSRLQQVENELAHQMKFVREYFMIISQSLLASSITIPTLSTNLLQLPQ